MLRYTPLAGRPPRRYGGVDERSNLRVSDTTQRRHLAQQLFSLSRPSVSAVCKKVDGKLNVVYLILRGVVAIRVMGRAGSICAIYSVVMGIGKAEDGRSTRIMIRRACERGGS
jgi:hypothetical protein